MKFLATILFLALSVNSFGWDYKQEFDQAKEYSQKQYQNYKSNKRETTTTQKYSKKGNSNVVNGKGRIIWVHDGDTFKVQTSNRTLNELITNNLLGKKYLYLKDSAFRSRLSNVNTEESVHYDKSRNTAKGKETSNYAKNTYSNQDVNFQCWEKGSFGRAVCSFQINGNDIAFDLISKNYSPYVDRYFRHPTMHSQYKNAERSAR
jgi:hypothetical protein